MNYIKVVTGPMFSGKTTELLKIASRAIGPQQVYKPSFDGRGERLKPRNMKASMACKNISSMLYVDTPQIQSLIIVDEIQLFSDLDCTVSTILRLYDRGHSLLVAGLDLDRFGNPFKPMPTLMSIATCVQKLTARCNVCEGPATRTFMKSPDKDDKKAVLVGDGSIYEPRCYEHWKSGVIGDERA